MARQQHDQHILFGCRFEVVRRMLRGETGHDSA